MKTISKATIWSLRFWSVVALFLSAFLGKNAMKFILESIIIPHCEQGIWLNRGNFSSVLQFEDIGIVIINSCIVLKDKEI